jgi:tripartite-type tricarboxylate transporter receptor subunit TctC
VRALFAEQSFRDRVMVPNMFEPMISSPDEFADRIKHHRAKWGKVLHDANIRID